ncbi:hypothetical protein BS78_10G227800 [Paspalum vaginatum]|nr:hypothetical protein BS78_10G227800 [Paspalum vaginatum]
MAMESLAIFCWVVLNAAALPHRRLLLPLRRRLLRDSTMLIILGASTLFHAVVVANPGTTEASHALAAAAGFLAWVAGVALLLLALTVDRFPAEARLAAQLLEVVAAGALF